MATGFKRAEQVVTWPEFRVAWVLIAIIIAALIIDAIVFPNQLLLLMEAGLLLIVFALTTVTIYRAAAMDRDTRIERDELRSMLASLEDGLIVYDSDFYVAFFNPAAERIFKLAAKNLLGHKLAPQDVERPGWRTFIQVIFPALAPRVITRSKEGEYPQVSDISFSDPPFEFRVTTAPVMDDNGAPLAFMKIVRDRTLQLASLRSKSEFVTIASHQLRGPVTDISWALDSLAHSDAITDGDKLIVQNASTAAHGLLRRIEDLLNISKMEEGQFGYEFKEADVADFLGRILADVLPSARTAGVKIYFDRPQNPLPRVNMDEKRLSLAVVNILENAIRYNVANGEVIVKVDVMAGKPFVEVSVKDTGIGIPAESIEKIFTKFYRADNAIKLQTEGSGLGLYISKNIITAHGGEIWMDSELNRGTTVHFTLPTDVNLIPKHELGLNEEI